MHRRRLLALSLTGAALVGLGGVGAAWWHAGLRDGRLSPQGRAVFEAVARAVLDGSLPEDPGQRMRVLDAHLQRLDAAVSGFPPALQAELSRMLAVLSAAPGRLALAGLSTAWSEASVAEVQTALESMRHSRRQLRQQVYHALRDLTNAAFYADPQSWALLDYPGPAPL